MLLAQEEGRESDRDVHLVMVARFDAHDVSVLGDVLDGFGNDIDVLLRILLLESDALDLLDEISGTAVEDRHLGCIDIDDAVIYAHRVEGTEGMLDGGDTPFTFFQDRTALRTGNVVREGLVTGLFRQINTTQANAGVSRCRVEGRRDL